MENLDAIIINRLGEHQRKVDYINRNINRRSETGFPFKKISYTILSVAACLAIVFAVSPMLFRSNNISETALTPPSFTEFRGTSLNNIESLINTGRYEDALLLVNSELFDIDNELESILTTNMNEDEVYYFTTLHRGEKEELLWSKIYLAVMLDRREAVLSGCLNYLNNSDFVRYRLEVENILKKIQ